MALRCAIAVLAFPALCVSYELRLDASVEDSVLYSWRDSVHGVIGVRVPDQFPARRLWESPSQGGVRAVELPSAKGTTGLPSFGVDVVFTDPLGVPQDRHIHIEAKVFNGAGRVVEVWAQVNPDSQWIGVQRRRLPPGYSFLQMTVPAERHGVVSELMRLRLAANAGTADERLVVADLHVTTKRTLSWTEGRARPEPIKPVDTGRVLTTWPTWLENRADEPSAVLSAAESPEGVGAFIGRMLEVYDRYQVKSHLRRGDVVTRHEDLVARASSLTSYYEQARQLLLSFEDSHLRLEPVREPERNRLVAADVMKLYRVDDKVVVVAVFDTAMARSVSVGDEVVQVDGVDIDSYVATRERSTFGSTAEIRDRKVIEGLLLLGDEKQQSLTLRRVDGSAYSFIHTAEGRFSRLVPKSFMRSRLHFERLGPYDYLRIGEWSESSTWAYFYSHIDSIRGRAGLILDLRSNAGGDLSMLRIAACFLDEPSRIASLRYRDVDDGGLSDLVINPSSDLRYDAPVVILADARTTCTSELFIAALQRYHKREVVVAAHGRIGGAVAAVWGVLLPQGYRLVYPHRTLDAFGRDLEGEGIQPDALVPLTSFRDLAPYDDRLLDVAVRQLDALTGRAATAHPHDNPSIVRTPTTAGAP